MKFYFPFFSSPYEQAIANKLQTKHCLSMPSEHYKNLLQLKKQLGKAATSIHQLRGIGYDANIWNDFERELNETIVNNLTVNQPLSDEKTKQFINQFRWLKNYFLEDEVLLKFYSGLNILANGVVAVLGSGTFLAASLMFSNPIGITALAVGLGLLSAALTVIALYSMYVDARFLINQQFRDIEELIYLANVPMQLDEELIAAEMAYV